jgi:antibiotic biosynthesis monooxygenase (ABM) superfamily enzyme
MRLLLILLLTFNAFAGTKVTQLHKGKEVYSITFDKVENANAWMNKMKGRYKNKYQFVFKDTSSEEQAEEARKQGILNKINNSNLPEWHKELLRKQVK